MDKEDGYETPDDEREIPIAYDESRVIKCQYVIRKWLTCVHISIHNKLLTARIIKKLKEHHRLYRYPVKAEYWEDIWDQCINSNGSNWIGGSHTSGADTLDENTHISYQNKSGVIKDNYVKITSHRTKDAGPSIEEKLDFICKNHCDKYVLLSRNETEWRNNIKSYKLIIFDSKLIDFKNLNG